MRKSLIAASFAVALAAPAMAGSMTVSFANDDGTTHDWVLGDDGNATAPDGTVVPYTWDEEALKLCATMPDDAEICATFAEAGTGTVGDTSAYTLSTGGTGTATIIALEE